MIETPSAGSRINQQAPIVGGSTDDTLDSVSLSIFEGQNTSGNQVFTESTLPVGTAWSVQPPSLAEGTYTAVAGQVNSTSGEPGISPAVTFTIHTGGAKNETKDFKLNLDDLLPEGDVLAREVEHGDGSGHGRRAGKRRHWGIVPWIFWGMHGSERVIGNLRAIM